MAEKRLGSFLRGWNDTKGDRATDFTDFTLRMFLSVIFQAEHKISLVDVTRGTNTSDALRALEEACDRGYAVIESAEVVLTPKGEAFLGAASNLGS